MVIPGYLGNNFQLRVEPWHLMHANKLRPWTWEKYTNYQIIEHRLIETMTATELRPECHLTGITTDAQRLDASLVQGATTTRST